MSGAPTERLRVSVSWLRTILPRRRRTRRLMLALLLGLGVAFRLVLTLRLPVGYDEIFVIAVGLLDMAKSGAAWLIETPMQRSSGLAPLWWWVEYTPFTALGDVTLPGLRLIPLLCSITAPVLGYACTVRRFGRRTATIFAGFLSLSDVLAFTTVRCDFFESLLMLFFVPAVCGAGARQRGLLRGLCWAGMALTFFGKALFIVALHALGEAVTAIAARRGAAVRLRALAVSALVAAAPVSAWFLLASRHYAGRPIDHEARRQAAGVMELIRAVTLDYDRTKAHMVGPPVEAALVWLDAGVWPVNALTLGVAILALGTGAECVRRGMSMHWTRRRRASCTLLVWSVVGAAYLIAKGAAGSRFHLMYLPALWLLAAAVLPRLLRGSLPARCTAFAVAGLAALLTLGWRSWSEGQWSPARALTAGAAVVGALALGLLPTMRSTATRARAISLSAIVMAVAALSLVGPLRWAPSAWFEPAFQRDPRDAGKPPWTESLLAVDAVRTGRAAAVPRRQETLDVALSNYFRTIEPPNLERAVHYGRRGVDRDPDNVMTWTYLGLALDESDADRQARLRTWERALRLKPESEFIQERLRRLQRDGGT